MGQAPQVKRKNYIAEMRSLTAAVKVADLYCQGVPTSEIANRLGVKISKVHVALQRAKQIWKAKFEESAELVKAEQLAKLDKIEAEAWAAWQRSKKIAIEQMRKESHSPKFGRSTEKGQKKIHRDGEAKYLDIVMRTIRQRLELLGIMKPESDVIANNSPLLEVIVSTRAEAARMLTYGDFASAVEGEGQLTVAAGSVSEVEV